MNTQNTQNTQNNTQSNQEVATMNTQTNKADHLTASVAAMVARKALITGVNTKASYVLGATIAQFLANSDEGEYNLVKLQSMIEESQNKGVEGVDMNTLADLKLVNNGVLSARLVEFYKSLDHHSNAPKAEITDENRVSVRFSNKVKQSKLVNDAIDALESTKYGVDKWLLNCVVKNGLYNEVSEGFVIKGCQALVEAGNPSVSSEFTSDWRGRMNHVSCFGPSSQSSDMARALMSVRDMNGNDITLKTGVRGKVTKAMVAAAKRVIKAEMRDMGCTMGLQAGINYAQVAPSAFIAKGYAKKPYSFVKAARILSQLEYDRNTVIDMAMGLDAKCSGPQIAALQFDGVKMAKACGFNLEGEGNTSDAYELAIEALKNAGFNMNGIARNDIKKAFMGVFYGQSHMAFVNGGDDMKGAEKVVEMIGGDKDKAKNFVSVIEGTFGSSVKGFRSDVRRVRKCGGLKAQAFQVRMEDGFEVVHNYKFKEDLDGERVDTFVGGVMTEAVDYTFNICGNEVRFEKVKIQTNDKDVDSNIRTAFVNYIQANDALMARHIIRNLKAADAQAILSVHDCFRVSVNDMIEGKLVEAIKATYKHLFVDSKYDQLVRLTNAINSVVMTKEEAKAAGIDKYVPATIKSSYRQFTTTTNQRITSNIGGVSIADIIDTLGTKGGAYFFAK